MLWTLGFLLRLWDKYKNIDSRKDKVTKQPLAGTGAVYM